MMPAAMDKMLHKRKRHALTDVSVNLDRPAQKLKVYHDHGHDQKDDSSTAISGPRTPRKYHSLPSPPSSARCTKAQWSPSIPVSTDVIEAARAMREELQRLQRLLNTSSLSKSRHVKEGEALVRNATAYIDMLTLPPLDLSLISDRPVSARNKRMESELNWDNACSTLREFIHWCSPEIAAKSLKAMAEGLPRRGPAPSVPAALTNNLGCWLAQSRNHSNGGHTQMIPMSDTGVKHDGASRPRPDKHKAQLCHRLAIRAWGAWEDVKNIVENQWKVSHRCHNSNCFNIDHLVVEPHHKNMARKPCANFRKCDCLLQPSCLFEKGVD